MGGEPRKTETGVVIGTESAYIGKLGSCVVVQRESRSWQSVGFAWASRITTLALEFAMPVVVGVGLDRWWRTGPLLTICGAVLGFGLFMFQTLRMAKELTAETDRAVARSRGDRK